VPVFVVAEQFFSGAKKNRPGKPEGTKASRGRLGDCTSEGERIRSCAGGLIAFCCNPRAQAFPQARK
jgi:hypothetical protein